MVPEPHVQASAGGGEIPRRLVLGAVLAAPVGLLAGCRVRLEDDAPHVPLVPTREPTQDEGLLVRAWQEIGELVRTATAVGAPGAGALRLHTAQLAVLDQELRDRKVPEAVRTATPSATAAGSGQASPAATTSAGVSSPTIAAAPSAPPTPAALGRLEAAAWTPSAVSALGTVHEPRAALLGSLATCRAVLATRLGTQVAWPAWGIRATAADRALEAAHRETRYYLEVAAARTPVDQRKPVLDQLDRVDSVVVRLASRRGGADDPALSSSSAAGATSAATSGAALATGSPSGAPPGPAPGTPAVGHALPFPVTDAASAARLVAHALSRLELACGAAWPLAAGDPEAMTTVCRLVADTLGAGADRGVPLRAFPGLRP